VAGPWGSCYDRSRFAMTLTRGTAFVLGTTLLASLLAATPRLRRGLPPDPAPAAAPRPAPAPAAAPPRIAIEQGRFGERLAALPAPRLTRRNPFEFVAPEPLAPPPRPAVDVPSRLEGPRLVPRPALTLIGIAEDHLPEGVRRRAILRTSDQVTLAGEGEEIAGRFVVVAIEPEAVTLRDRQGGGTFRLVLR
jgi:hypothetical protein